MSLKSQGRIVLCLLGAVLLLASAAVSQTLEKGAISGTVFDPSGAVVPNASVKIVHVSTSAERKVTTGPSGRYSADLLPAGEYRIEVSASGFATTIVKDVRLTVGQSLIQDVTLKLAAVGERVEVSAEPGPIDRGETLVKTVVAEVYVERLPIGGRDFRDFVNLSSTADLTPGLRSPIRLGGQYGEYTGFVIDGVDNRNSFFGEWFGSLETKNFTVPQDAIKEFQVRDTGFSAEFGHALGGMINVATKSGTNTWHGTAHWFFISADTVKNATVAARPGQKIPPEFNTRHQFGGTIGGPLVRDKLFLFFALDNQQRGGPLTTRFSDGVHNTCVAAPTACAVDALYGGGTLLRLEGVANQKQDLTTPLLRLDWNIRAKHMATTRINYTRNETHNFTGGRSQTFVVGGVESNFENFVNAGWAASQSLTSVLGPATVNEVRVAYSREIRPRINKGLGPETCIFPFDDCFGRRFFLPIDSTHQRYQVIDNLSHTFGKHDLKLGVDLNSNGNAQTFIGFAGGMYNFLGLNGIPIDTNGDGVPDINVGNYSPNAPGAGGQRHPLFFLQLVGINGFDAVQSGTLSTFWQNEFSWYVQDNWRIHRHVTLNLGLRWDGIWNPNPQFPIIGKQVPVGRPRRTSGGVELTLAPVPQGIPDDMNNWAPRVSVAWDVGGRGKTIVRGGAGVYYAPLPSIFMAEILAGQGFRGGTIALGGPQLGCPTDLSIPRLCYPQVLPSKATATLQALLPPPLIRYADPNFESARVTSVQGGVEREIVKDFSLSASYSYSRGENLRVGSFWNSRFDRNWCPVRTSPCPASSVSGNTVLYPSSELDQFGRLISPYSRAPLPANAGIIGLADDMASFARSRYHALMLQTKKSFSHRTQFGFNYTISKQEDNASNDRDTDAYYAPSDPLNLDIDFGRGQLDIRHQFRAFGYFVLPANIQLSTIVTARSGRAFPAYIARCGSEEAGEPTIARSDDCSGLAFNMIRPVVNGKVLPRFPFRNANFFNWDLRLARDFKVVTEKLSLRVTFEVFNLFDRDNSFSFPPNSNNAILDATNTKVSRLIDSPSPVGAGGPMAVQFGLKFIF